MNHPDNYKEAYEEMHDLFTALKEKFEDCQNELCFCCGKYQKEHLGACDGCRWQH